VEWVHVGRRGPFYVAEGFSRSRTRFPVSLNEITFLLVYFKAMNSLLDLSRLVQVVAPPILVLVCDRFFTAPLRVVADRFVGSHGVILLCWCGD
jgi:hypothetical protein